jgi:hypothetical protein
MNVLLAEYVVTATPIIAILQAAKEGDILAIPGSMYDKYMRLSADIKEALGQLVPSDMEVVDFNPEPE